MRNSIYSKKGSGKLAVEIAAESSCDSFDLLTTRNGFQYSGMPINKELAILIIAALSDALANGELDK